MPGPWLGGKYAVILEQVQRARGGGELSYEMIMKHHIVRKKILIS